jgi:His/Glu/Gln/Arg/opine family amino acid ABC transporter permease subunit
MHSRRDPFPPVTCARAILSTNPLAPERPPLCNAPAESLKEKPMRFLPCLLLIVAALALTPRSARAGTLAEVRQRGTLRWGGDQEGGGPYVYPRRSDPNQVTGFEVEVAARLAAVLHVQPQFVQGDWDEMPEMLRTGKIDVIINGYELTPARLETMDASIPYYVYRLQLMARKGDRVYSGWDSFTRSGRVGVLTGSAAETYMRRFCAGAACKVIGYDGNTDTMLEVETGKLDGTLEDTPVAAFYAPRFPGLVPMGKPVGEGFYVMYINRGEPALLQAINQAIIGMIRNGDLERIYRKYNIWDDAQQRLLQIAEDGRFYGYQNAVLAKARPGTVPVAPAVNLGAPQRGWSVVRDYGGVLLQSAGMTVILSVLSFPLAIGFGLLVAVGRLYGPKWIMPPLAAYVEFLRGTPLMLQLYFIFFFLPQVGISVPAFWTAILGLAINYSAYESEIYRAGLQAVPRGQMEAALSLGMSRRLSLRRIVVPQAARIVIPPVVSDFISLYKDTSVCSVITVVELTKRFSVLSMSTQATLQLMLMTGALYLLMSYPVAVASRRMEKRLGVGVAAL